MAWFAIAGGCFLCFIMTFTRCNDDGAICFPINDSVRCINSSAPPAAQVSPQWLRFANPTITAALYIFDDGIDSA